MKFDLIFTSYNFKENVVNPCIYMKVNGSNYIFLVLYIDDILLAYNNSNLLSETKILLFGHFDMKDPGEALYVLGIQILCDRAINVLRLSQKTYIDRVLKRFNMQS